MDRARSAIRGRVIRAKMAARVERDVDRPYPSLTKRMVLPAALCLAMALNW